MTEGRGLEIHRNFHHWLNCSRKRGPRKVYGEVMRERSLCFGSK